MTIALERDTRLRWLTVVALGCAAFGFVHLKAMLPPPHYGVLGVTVAAGLAVVQEVVFRRFLYAQFERFGPAVAVFVTAGAFALFHVPRYGWGVLLIDFAAGLIFSWQRYATGSWTASAATHVFANLVALW